MKIIAVDDEMMGLEALTDAIKEADPSIDVVGFDSSLDALEYVKGNKIDAAFLDIFMAEMDGIELAKSIKLLDPRVQIVFASGYDDYMKDAFQLHANGYVLKPITPEKVKVELDNLKNIYRFTEEVKKTDKRIRFQCFGNFEAFVDEKPIKFKYDRTKEMLAYIVSRRGALCTNGEIIVNLWEDDESHDSYLRGIRKDLMDVLREHDLENVIFQQRGKIGIDINAVACDYYDFLNGDVAAINSYKGEFISQYSWSEMLNAEMFMER